MISYRIRLVLACCMMMAACAVVMYINPSNYLSIHSLQAHKQGLLMFVRDNYSTAVLLYIALYVVLTGLSLPSAAVLTLSAGFLFNTVPGAVYAVIGATLGATVAFLSVRYLAGQWIQERYSERLAAFNTLWDAHGAWYLMLVRLIPIFPFFLVNIGAGLTRMPLRTFVWATILGCFPDMLIYTFAGYQLRSVHHMTDLFSGKLIGVLSALMLLLISPLIARFLWRLRK